MKKNIIKYSVNILLILATLVATVCKILYGFDKDEGLTVMYGLSFVKNHSIYKEAWDVEIMSAIPQAIILSILHWITKGYDYAIIVSRIVAAFFQFALAIWSYVCLKKYYKNAFILSIMIANILPRATLNLEYGFLGCSMVLISSILLFLVEKNEKFGIKQICYILVAAFAESYGVLAYPTMITAFFVVLIYYLRNYYKKTDKEALKKLFIYSVTCGSLAIIFFLFLLKNMTFEEMVGNIFNGVLAEGSHSNHCFIESFLISKNKMIQLLSIGFVSIVLQYLSQILFHFKQKLVYWVMITSSASYIFLNVTRIRVCGPLGMQVRIILVIIASLPIFIKETESCDKWLFGLVGIVVYMGAVVASNLSITENSYFSVIYLIYIVMMLDNQELKFDIKEIFKSCSVLLFIVSFIFCKGYLVRIDGTGPSTIMDERAKAEFWVFKGIYLSDEQISRYAKGLEDVRSTVKQEDVVAIFTYDPIYYLAVDSDFSVPTLTDTPVFDEQWVRYYKDTDYLKPNIILLDKRIKNADLFLENNTLGKYLAGNIYNQYETDSFFIFELKWENRKELT